MKDFAIPRRSLRRRTLKDTIKDIRSINIKGGIDDIVYNGGNLRNILIGTTILITGAITSYPMYKTTEFSSYLSSLFSKQGHNIENTLTQEDIQDLKAQQMGTQNVEIVSEDFVSRKNNVVKIGPKSMPKLVPLSLEPKLVDSTLHYLQLGVFANKENADALYQKFDDKWGFEVLREKKVVNGKKLESILVNYYGDEKLRSFIEGEAGIVSGIPVKREGKINFYSRELKDALIDARCSEVNIDKDYFLSIGQNESANGLNIFGFDFEPSYKKTPSGELVRNDNGKLIVEGYIHKLDDNGKIDKLTAVGEYHINPLAHNEKVRDLVDYEYNLKKAISYVHFLHNRYDGDLGKMASAYVAGTNGNFKRKEVTRYKDAVVSTYNNLKKKAIEESQEIVFASR